MEVVTGKRQEVPTAKVVETSLRSVPPEGFEPPTFGTGNQRSIQLSYARIVFSIP